MDTTFTTMFSNLWAKFLSVIHSGLEAIALGVSRGSIWAFQKAQPVLNDLGWETPTEQNLAVSAILAAFALGLFLTLLIWMRRGKDRIVRAQLQSVTSRPRRFGYAAAGLLIVVFGGWSILAPLASASIANGVVSPDGSRKTVAHLEGGIIRSIHVREGDVIVNGDPLLSLEDVQARARFEEMRERFHHLLAIEARLLAQRSGLAEIAFPEELSNVRSANVIRAMIAQRALLDSQRKTQDGHESILRQRVLQLDEQNAGLRQVNVAQDRQLELLRQEIESVQDLLDKGLAKVARLLALQRAEAALDAERATIVARIAENRQRMGETQIQLLTMQEVVVEKANDDLADIQRQLAEIRSQMPSRADILKRTVIRAPISGTVMNIRPTTEAGVLQPGEAILEIVPKEAKLIIDAQVSPNDVDRVRPGMEARVVLSAYRQRSMPLIHGVLRSISADRLVEERTGQPYFLAKVEVNRKDLDNLKDVRLIPGMSAEVMIVNDEQTILQYLLDPLLGSFNRSFREG